jgi:hypothetical protein
LFHDEAQEQLNAFLRKPLPPLIIVAKGGCPGAENGRVSGRGGEDGKRQTVSIDQGYFENVC